MKRIITLTLIYFITVTCILSALSSRKDPTDKNSKPQWLSNPQSQYPEQLYLVAIGEGDNRGRAEADAAANLAKIFETRVQSEELLQERYREIVSDQSYQAQTESDIDKTISLTADQTLYNIQYAESYTDNLGRVYVLGYIDRHRTADIYMDMIDRHNQGVLFYNNRAAETDQILTKYAYKSAASVISTANETLLEQFKIIAPDYKEMIKLDYDHNTLLYETRSLAQNLRFKISLDNDKDGRLYSVLADMLTNNGFTVTNDGDIAIDGVILLEEVDLQRTEKFMRWHLALHMKDPQGQTLITHSERGREGHINQTEAVARAYRTMEREIRQQFNRKLFAYFDNLVK